MTSILTPNQTAYWEMKARHLEVDNRRLVEHIERIAEQYRKGDNKKALDQVITWAENLVARYNDQHPVTKEDEHRDDVVAALVKMVDEDDTDQAKAIYDAMALIEGDNG